MIDEARDLYAVDPAGFVAARTQLVRELKAAKRKDDAAAVAKLQRPRLGEYVMNRVARDQPDVVVAFAGAVAAATAAQSSAIGSGDASALRTSSATLRVASSALVDAAMRQLQQDGLDGPNRRDEMLTVVRSLTTEPGAAQLVAGIVGSGETPTQTELFAGAPEPHVSAPKPKPAKQASAARPTSARPDTTTPAPAAPSAPVAPAGPTKAELAKERRRLAELERATGVLAKAEREVTMAQRAVDAATKRLAEAEAARATAADELSALDDGT
jgi:hypothetical protein